MSTLWLAALALAMSCGDDEPPSACTPGSSAGCANGQLCATGPDGKAGCFCDPDTASGCSDGLECQTVEGDGPGCFCSSQGQVGCAAGEVCERVVDGNNACFPPVTVSGMVFDLADGAAVAGAHVVARDANNVAVSSVAVTDDAGNYDLTVLNPRTKDGALAENFVTLRADAADYVSFPTPPRFAVPFNTANASGEPLTLQSTATDVGLLVLSSTAGLGTVTGTVVADAPRGTLVVAGGSAMTGGGVTGIADFDGSYTVFNVPAGNVTVKGYIAFTQLEPTSAEVTAGAVTSGVDLLASGEATAAVSGKVEIVNPGNGKETSIILVVDETFIENVASGQAPPGLRAYPVTGGFLIEGVPDGNYVVLAAFENDNLVRDPDTAIGGTSLVRITVAGGSMDLSESFKVTGSLDDVSPDAEEVVSGVPTFVFADDSGEDHYELVLYDAYGNLIWEKLDVPGVSGSATVSVPYEGPALDAGVIYQFRATSIKGGGSPLSRTEDLRGVFLYQ